MKEVEAEVKKTMAYFGEEVDILNAQSFFTKLHQFFGVFKRAKEEMEAKVKREERRKELEEKRLKENAAPLQGRKRGRQSMPAKLKTEGLRPLSPNLQLLGILHGN